MRPRPFLGRLHPAGAQPPSRRGRRRAQVCSPCGRPCSGRAPTATCPAEQAARLDARRRRRPGPRQPRPARAARRVARRARRRRRRRRRSAARERAPPGRTRARLEDSPIVSVHLWLDRQLLRPRSRRCSTDAHWVFDRGSLTGSPPERGQYLTVVSSGVPELLEVRGRELVERIACQLTERLGEAELLWLRVSREPYATVALRPGVERPGAETFPPQRRARGRLDRHRLAGDDGERDPQRPGGSSAHLEQHFRRSYGCRWRDLANSSGLDAAIERGTRRLLELQRPDGVWVGELESNVTMTAQHLFWHHYLDLRMPDLDRRHRERAHGADARRRHVVDLVRGPAGPVHVDRGVRRPAASRASTPAQRRSPISGARAGSRRAGCSRSASWR